MDETTKIEALRVKSREAMAAAIDVEAELADAEGDYLAAEWARARAAVYRSGFGAAENAVSHRAYIVMQAHAHVAKGAPIDPAYAAEIAAEVERLRAEDSGPRTVGASD